MTSAISTDRAARSGEDGPFMKRNDTQPQTVPFVYFVLTRTYRVINVVTFSLIVIRTFNDFHTISS